MAEVEMENGKQNYKNELILAPLCVQVLAVVEPKTDCEHNECKVRFCGWKIHDCGESHLVWDSPETLEPERRTEVTPL